MDLSNTAVVRALLDKHGLTLSKGLGQNFLIDPTVCPRIAELGDARPGFGVLEIGPGVGVLTRELARRADKVAAVEIDDRLLPVLADTLSDCGNVHVVSGDVMKLDLAVLLAEEFGDMPVAVCANLPYYITSPILMRLLESRLPLTSLTVMVQREAALRLCAPLGTRACGAVTVAVRYYSEPSLLFEVPRQSFLPAPKVDSCVIRLDVRTDTPSGVTDEAFFFHVVAAAFSQRRKTLNNAVSAGLAVPKERVAQALAQAGIKPAARAEELSMEQFIALANALHS